MAPAPLPFWSSFLVQSCACNVHPSCYVQLSFNIAMLLYSYSIIWTDYTIFSHVTPAKCLSAFQFKAILMSVVVWTQGTFVEGVEILTHKVCICSNRIVHQCVLEYLEKSEWPTQYAWKRQNLTPTFPIRRGVHRVLLLEATSSQTFMGWTLTKSSSNVTVFGNKNVQEVDD